jgi:hypothetical protein
MFLLDTCIVLELLLDQEQAGEVERFLRTTSPDLLHLSEFSLYSLGIILLRRQAFDAFLRMVDDLLLTGGVTLVRLGPENMDEVVRAAQSFRLDFDDAYQYAVATKHDLTIVSFDSDFDRTEQQRQTPAELLRT